MEESTETGRPRRASTRGISFIEADSEDESVRADQVYIDQSYRSQASDPSSAQTNAQLVGPPSQDDVGLMMGRSTDDKDGRVTLGGALAAPYDPDRASTSQGSIEWHPTPVRADHFQHFLPPPTYLPPPMPDRPSDQNFGGSLLSYSLSSPTYSQNGQYSLNGPTSRPPQLAPMDYRFGWPSRQESAPWTTESIGGIDYASMGPEQPVARWHGGLPGFAHQAPPRIEGDYRDSRRPSVASSLDQYTPLSPTDSEIADGAYYDDEQPLGWPALDNDTVRQTDYDPVQASKPKSHSRKRPPGHIARPPNQFLLYRSHVIKNNLIPSALEIRDHKQISMIVGQMWQALSPDKKSYWAQKAQRVKEQHARMYPHFSQVRTASTEKTRKPRKSTSRKDKTHDRDKLRCEAVAKVLIATAGDGLGATQPAADIQPGTLEAVDLNDKINAAMRQASYDYAAGSSSRSKAPPSLNRSISATFAPSPRWQSPVATNPTWDPRTFDALPSPPTQSIHRSFSLAGPQQPMSAYLSRSHSVDSSPYPGPFFSPMPYEPLPTQPQQQQQFDLSTFSISSNPDPIPSSSARQGDHMTGPGFSLSSQFYPFASYPSTQSQSLSQTRPPSAHRDPNRL